MPNILWTRYIDFTYHYFPVGFNYKIIEECWKISLVEYSRLIIERRELSFYHHPMLWNGQRVVCNVGQWDNSIIGIVLNVEKNSFAKPKPINELKWEEHQKSSEKQEHIFAFLV